MLLNEFLKQRKKVEDQQETIAQLKSDATKEKAARIELKSAVAQQQKAMEILTAQLQEQAAQIQRVSARLEMNERATQTVCLPAVALREGGNNP
jgi:chromosome segregation ATPase